MIKDKIKKIKSGKLTAEQNIRNFIGKIKENDKAGKKINCFLQLNNDALFLFSEVL